MSIKVGCPGRAVAFVMFLLLFFVTDCSAGLYTWAGKGPYGEYVAAIAAGPVGNDAGYVEYVVTRRGEVFRKGYGEHRWESCFAGPAFSVVADSVSAGTAWIGTSAGIIKTTDGGRTWSAPQGPHLVTSLVVNPSAAGAMYAGNYQGIFRTSDGGESWTSVTSGLPSVDVRSIAIDPADGNVVYVTTPSGLFRSENKGDAWTIISDGAFCSTPVNISVSNEVPKSLYAWNPACGLFRSADKGVNWEHVEYGTLSALSAFAVMRNPSTLFAGTGEGVFTSSDGGKTWLQPEGLKEKPITSIFPMSQNIVYAGTTTEGVFRTLDGGVTWTWISTGLTAMIGPFAFDPTTPGVAYVPSGWGLYKTADSGATWDLIQTGEKRNPPVAVAVAPTVPASVYVGLGNEGEIIRSRDGGGTWTNISTGIKSDTHVTYAGITVDPLVPTTVYAPQFSRRLFKTNDGGDTWNWIRLETLLMSQDVFTVAVNPKNSSTVFACTFNEGVYKSTNDGTSWIPSNNGMETTFVTGIVFDPVTPSTMYASTWGDGVFKTTDGGAKWTAASTGLTSPRLYGIAINSSRPSEVAVGTSDNGVFVTTDGGGSWHAATSGLENIPVRSVAFSPTTPPVLYAGTTGKGFVALVRSPLISVSRDSLNFGQIPLGIRGSMNVTIKNTGTAPLSLNPSLGTGTEVFSLAHQSENPCAWGTSILEEDESCTLSVIFAPQSYGDAAGVLRISSNAVDQPVIDVPVFGGGLASGRIVPVGGSVTAGRDVVVEVEHDPSPSSMRLRAGEVWGAWVPFAEQASVRLPKGDGEKTISVMFRSDQGATFGPYSTTVRLDTTPPQGSVSINGGAAYATRSAVSVVVAASDSGGVAQMMISLNGGKRWGSWVPYANLSEIALPPGDGVRNIAVRLKDDAGNVSKVFHGKIVVDTVPPSGKVTFKVKTGELGSAIFDVTVKAHGSPVMMQASGDGETWGEWTAFRSRFIQERRNAGAGRVFLRLKDAAGNVSAVIEGKAT